MLTNQITSKISVKYQQEVFDFRDICQQQFEEFALQIPLVAARFVYLNTNTNEHQLVEFYTQKLSRKSIDCYRLELEGRLLEDLPILTLSEIEIESNLKTVIYPLNSNSSRLEYLLLFTSDSLSQIQKQWINQQVLLLINYLNIFREFQRQKVENQLLEQVIQCSEHQLRHSIGLISLYAENLCLALPDSPELKQAQIIRETVNNLGNDLKRLLKCGQQERLHINTCDLTAITADSIKGLQPWLEEKQISINCPATSIIIAVDSLQIKYVFDNILSNAIYFSPQGATISCHWQAFRDELLVEIADQGPGISPEELQQVFTPFYSKRSGGTGLGLAIAKKIILDHRGNLWAENLPNGGAQFSFTLPRTDYKNQKQKQKSRTKKS